MNPNQLSFGMSDDIYQSQSTPDSLEELLSQLLSDIPTGTFPIHTSTPMYAWDEPTSAPTPLPPPLPNLTCQWVCRHDPPLVCGASLPFNHKHACAHFRLAHNVRGNDKAIVKCRWYGCRAPPMQRGSLIRHLLTVHLGLLRWQCERCGRVFSRRGTGHVCDVGDGA